MGKVITFFCTIGLLSGYIIISKNSKALNEENAFLRFISIQTKINLKLAFIAINNAKIAEEENSKIILDGGAPAYGEITYEGLGQLLKILNLTLRDVFYDLGSGLGKVVLQTYMTTPVFEAVGIEISPTRYAASEKALNRLKRLHLLPSSPNIHFINNNIGRVNLNKATVIFMCSTCYPDSFLEDLVSKLQKLPNLRLIASLKELPEINNFVLDGTVDVSTTWSVQTPVYIYINKQNASPISLNKLPLLQNSKTY